MPAAEYDDDRYNSPAETLAQMRVLYPDHGPGCQCSPHWLMRQLESIRVEVGQWDQGEISAEDALRLIVRRVGGVVPRKARTA